MWTELLTALALVFIIEGIMPFLNPDGVRKMFMMASQLNNTSLRFMGLTSMLLGLVFLYLVR
ncbi:MAG: DUF2065 domain-containing protein [Gammaproteobacteria bacterium]|nr:DUF2065 domain-containing protein [Gammaproteobacteria bacterium]